MGEGFIEFMYRYYRYYRDFTPVAVLFITIILVAKHRDSLVWELGVISALAGLLAVSLGVNYLVLRRLDPAIGYVMGLAEKGDKLLTGLTEGGGGGGRPAEGLMERILAIPAVQNAISGVAQNMLQGTGGGSHTPGFVRK